MRTSVIGLGLSLVATIASAPVNAAAYNSNVDPDVTPMFSGFATLSATTQQQNRQMVIAINRAATPAEMAEAARTTDFPFTSTRISIPEAFGSKLQPALLAAEDSGQLPLTLALLAQHHGNQNESELDTNSAWASIRALKAHFKSPRPYCAISSLVRAIPSTTPSGHQIYMRDCSHPGDDYSFPSGHSRSAYIEGITLATFLPEIAPQILARTAQVANNRVVLGAHYPLDIIGGRALATRIVAARYRDPVWHTRLEAARSELRSALEKECGGTLPSCVASQTAFMPTAEAISLFEGYLTYRCTLPKYCITPTTGFTQTGPTGVAFTPPTDAADLLSDAYPDRSPTEINSILTSTAIASGYPLDTSGTAGDPADSGWTRINLARALTYRGTAPPTAAKPVETADDGSNLLVRGVAIGGPSALALGLVLVVATRRRKRRSLAPSGRHRSR